jgi:hypothetical protein
MDVTRSVERLASKLRAKDAPEAVAGLINDGNEEMALIPAKNAGEFDETSWASLS